MSQLSELEKLKDKLEQDHKKHKTFGQYVMLPALQNAMGAFALGVFIYIVGYIWFGYSNPFDSKLFREWTIIICTAFWAILTFIYVSLDEVRILKVLIFAYRSGFNDGSKVLVGKELKNSRTQTSVENRWNQLMEDVKIVLEWYYGGDDRKISRDALLTRLSHRKNSRASTETVMKFLFDVGILIKGSSRNDPIEVVPKSYDEAKNMIKSYIDSNRK